MQSAEESILIAALDGDIPAARAKVYDLLPGEREKLAAACRAIEELCDSTPARDLPAPEGYEVSDDGYAYGYYRDSGGVLKLTLTGRRWMSPGHIGYRPIQRPSTEA